MKKVYVSMTADLLHAGHIKVLNEANKYGEVTVGLLTSTAINELNDTAYLKYQQRLEVIKNVKLLDPVKLVGASGNIRETSMETTQLNLFTIWKFLIAFSPKACSRHSMKFIRVMG